jgi:hypothetical protein
MTDSRQSENNECPGSAIIGLAADEGAYPSKLADQSMGLPVCGRVRLLPLRACGALKVGLSPHRSTSHAHKTIPPDQANVNMLQSQSSKSSLRTGRLTTNNG